MEKKKIVFLYTELASYFLACINKLVQEPNIDVHIVRWDINEEAPFNFSFSQNVRIYNRKDYKSDFRLQQLISSVEPSIIYCSGWLDQGYLKVCRSYKGKIPVIVGLDNQWKGSIRQQVACILSPFKILPYFSHCWVPGPLQQNYALRLGFNKENILTGFYCCDFDFFNKQYFENKVEKQTHFPKRFIYVGRYVEEKGVKDLWNAFIEIQNSNPNNWELWCIGTGPVKPQIHPAIHHFGFVQPEHFPEFLKKTGVFVLPSHFEPWGVVVHEFCSAGFPIICSDQVGARLTFVEHGYNGYIYKSEDLTALKESLMKIINADQEALLSMSEKSVKKANIITPEFWVKQLLYLLE